MEKPSTEEFYQNERERYLAWVAKARKLGATVQGGINWTWANGFPTMQAAQEFERTPGMETRGVYPGKDGTFDVRFR